jgi:hypothetical protein
MSAATTDRLLGGEWAIRDFTESPIGPTTLASFLAAQVEAREMRAGQCADVVRSLTHGIRRMKKAGSPQGLGRQACTELCDALVDESGHRMGESSASVRWIASYQATSRPTRRRSCGVASLGRPARRPQMAV